MSSDRAPKINDCPDTKVLPFVYEEVPEQFYSFSGAEVINMISTEKIGEIL